jgi:hypothetical protein
MNKKQKIVLGAGIILIVLMGLFPPYEVVRKVDQVGRTIEGPIKYGFLLSPPGDIDIVRLAIQWVIILALTIGTIYSTKDLIKRDSSSIKKKF